MEYILGIDIGGTNTVSGIVDKNGKIHNECVFETAKYLNAEVLINDIYSKYKDYEMFSNISGVGIGAPNGNYFSGCIEYAPNLKWGNNIPIVAIAEKFFNLPVKLTNDANAAALGEKYFGCAKSMSDFVVLTIGTGLGSGIFVNGKIVHGKHGYAGEFGHTKAEQVDRICTCGLKGCLETVVSSRGIKQTYKEIYISKNKNLPLTEISVLEIYNLALLNNEIALETFEYTAKILAQSLANLIMILDNEAVIFFGGIANAYKILIPMLEKELNKLILTVFANKIKLLPSALLNRNAAVLGSAALFLNSNEP